MFILCTQFNGRGHCSLVTVNTVYSFVLFCKESVDRASHQKERAECIGRERERDDVRKSKKGKEIEIVRRR